MSETESSSWRVLTVRSVGGIPYTRVCAVSLKPPMKAEAGPPIAFPRVSITDQGPFVQALGGGMCNVWLSLVFVL